MNLAQTTNCNASAITEQSCLIRPIDYAHARVLVAGLGVSGRSVVQVLESLGATVVTYDQRVDSATYQAAIDIDFDNIDVVVTSPTFAPFTDFIVMAQQHGIPVISEVEFAWQVRTLCSNDTVMEHSHLLSFPQGTIVPQEFLDMETPAPWIGITGTNGKTSTTEMVATILQYAGLDAPAVGNIGDPVSLAARNSQHQALVVELSSFQLHFTDSLALAGAAITNIAQDHIDWHQGIEDYIASKAKVYRNVRDVLVYNADDETVTRLAQESHSSAKHCVGFTLNIPREGQIGVEHGWIVDRSTLTRGNATVCTGALAKVADFTHLLQANGEAYPHLLADALCALALAIGIGINPMVAVRGLQQFKPGGHRIEQVAQITDATSNNSIVFIDDSKATNAHAAAASLRSFADHHVVWIAGGLAKGAHFDDLIIHERAKIKVVIMIGVDNTDLLAALETHAPEIPIVRIAPHSECVMREAVGEAVNHAEFGDVVLLAPACASMDQFVSYADRGNQFAQCAQRIAESYVNNNHADSE